MIFFNQKGFSLVQGMIIASVIAGSALITTRMMTDQKLAQKGAETRDQIDQLHSMAYAMLQNRSNCIATINFGGPSGASLNLITPPSTPDLINKPVTPRTVNIEDIRTLSKITKNSDGEDVYLLANTSTALSKHTGTNDLTKTYMNGNVIIRDMQLVYPATDIPNNKGLALLHIDYQRLTNNDSNNVRTKQGFGAKDIRKTMLIRIQRHPTKLGFDGCYAVTESFSSVDSGNKDLSSKLCTELSSEDGEISRFFRWDEDISQCVLNDHTCEPGYLFTGINSNGETKCRRLDEWIDINEYIDTGSTTTCALNSTARLVITDGKVRIDCN